MPTSSAAPSPTIAAVVRTPSPAVQPRAQPSPSPANPAAQPSATLAATPIAAAPATRLPAAEPSIYLWPADLPADLTVSAKESRVVGENELGPNGLGFYLITLNANGKKLVVGGGDLGEVLPLAGDERQITVGQRSGKLIASGQQRELVLDVPRGKLFLYSQGFAEDELLRVAESLQPIDVRMLRQMVAAQ